MRINRPRLSGRPFPVDPRLEPAWNQERLRLLRASTYRGDKSAGESYPSWSRRAEGSRRLTSRLAAGLDSQVGQIQPPHPTITQLRFSIFTSLFPSFFLKGKQVKRVHGAARNARRRFRSFQRRIFKSIQS